MAHQAVAIGEAADDAALYQCAHQVEREEDVEIALGVAVIVVAVGDGQIAQWGCGRNGAVGRVATGIGHVERWLIPQMYPAGRDQVQPGRMQGFAEWCERNFVEVEYLVCAAPQPGQCRYLREDLSGQTVQFFERMLALVVGHSRSFKPGSIASCKGGR